MRKYEIAQGMYVDGIEENIRSKMKDSVVDIIPCDKYHRRVYSLNDGSSKYFEIVEGRVKEKVFFSREMLDSGYDDIKVGKEALEDIKDEFVCPYYEVECDVKVGIFYRQQDIDDGLRNHIENSIKRKIEHQISREVRHAKTGIYLKASESKKRLDLRMEKWKIDVERLDQKTDIDREIESIYSKS